MTARINAKLAAIYAETRKISLEETSLFGGNAGLQLFNTLYLQQNCIEDDPALQDNIQELAERSLSFSHPGFCNGLAGINWLFEFLWRKKILTTKDKALLCYRDKELGDASLEMLRNGNYDFLHGAIGIASYLLYSSRPGPDPFYTLFFRHLHALIDQSLDKDSIPHYDFRSGRLQSGETNLGLAHGLPSILKFCLQCYKQKICTDESSRLAHILIDYLRTHGNADTSHTYYAHILSKERPGDVRSRLAWCYGDPGIGFILYQAGLTFRDPTLTAFSMEVLLHTTRRRNAAEAGISDAGICHGSAGVAHIYHKMWRYTTHPLFKDARDHWIRQTLDYGEYDDGVGGYKKYDGANKTHVKEYGLLEGAAGIGLVLLSYLGGDCCWDHCLLLND